MIPDYVCIYTYEKHLCASLPLLKKIQMYKVHWYFVLNDIYMSTVSGNMEWMMIE
jgi:hypothetical protein